MAKINPEQLQRTFSPSLKPVYLISGDEPLLVQEACDLVRNAARAQGFAERELYHANAQFQWGQVVQSANSFSLFADKKIIEVRLQSTKIGDPGKKAIQAYCATPNDDNLLLLVSPKLDRTAQNSAWCKSINDIGVIVTVWPINQNQMPRWLGHRLKQAGLKADSGAIEVLSSKVEGNLLAAIQEIEKLKLAAPKDVIDAKVMARAVLNSARYDVFGLMDKTLGGNARAASACLNGLKAEGTEPVLVVWAVSRDIRMLLSLKHLQRKGQSLDQQARSHGVFPQRLPLVKQALTRLTVSDLETLIEKCGDVDRSVKGMNKNDPWATLLTIILGLVGQELKLP